MHFPAARAHRWDRGSAGGVGQPPSDVSLSALRRYSQDISPLVLRAKRRGSSVITPERLDVVVKRRRLAKGVSPRRPTLLERLSSPKLR